MLPYCVGMRVRGYAPATPCWAEYAAANSDAAAAFYCGLFGWETADKAFTLDGRAVAGMRPGQPNERSGWLSYVATDDVAATADQVVGAGGTLVVPPLAVGDHGTAAFVTDPSGAVFALWQHGAFHGAGVASEPGAVCWTEVVTWDRASATAFYGKVFEWEDRDNELVEGLVYTEWVCHGRVVGGLSVMDQRYPAGTPTHWRTTFEVADCAATAARAAELGATILLPPSDVMVGHYAQILDPLGGAFSIIELIPELRLSI
jgi:predicted enzyme related to lactoylglutathione lyase